jgi:hypothetical protein
MNMQHARIVLRPRGVLDAFDLSVRLLRTEYRTFGPLALVVLGPAVALVLVGGAFGFGTETALALFALLPVIELPFTVAASKLVFQPKVTVGLVLRESIRTLPGLLALRLFELVLLALGTGAAGLPALFAALATFFLGETFVLERSGLVSAAKRSRALGFAGLSEAFAGLLVFAIVRVSAFCFGDVGGRAIAHDVFGFRAPISVFEGGPFTSALLFSLAIVPVLAVTRFVLYLAVRTTLEGWDIQTRFVAIAAEHAAFADDIPIPATGTPPVLR